MNEQTKSEFNEVNSMLEKRLYESDEYIKRIRWAILRFGALQESPNTCEKEKSSPPSNVESVPELHRLQGLSDKLNKSNNYLQNLVTNLERLV